MKITPKNAANVLDFDLGGILRWANEVTRLANERGPGHIKAIRHAAWEVKEFVASLSTSHVGAVDLIPGAPSLAEENAEAEAVVAYVVKRNAR